MFSNLLIWPPIYSWLAKAIKWLSISSALVSHPMLLTPSNGIRMSSLYLCITGRSRWTKSPILLPPFPNLHTRAVSLSLKEWQQCQLVCQLASTYRQNDHK